MTPYYDEDGITIYHGDAKDVMPPMWSLIADGARVLITDPPFGVGFSGKETKHGKADGGYLGEDDPEVGPRVVRQWLPYVARAVVFTGKRLMFHYPEPTDIGCVYLPSGSGMSKWGFSVWTPVLFYGKRPDSKQLPVGLMSHATVDKHNEHPCPKPLPWMKWATTLATRPGDLVVDPFMGSGTTLVAAKQAGLQAVGIEIEKQYCEIAVERLAQGVLALEET